MAQTTSLVFNGGVIPSPSPAPSGSGKAKLLKIGEITVTEQEVQVTKNVICDPDSVTTVAPFMEVLTSARLAELISANNILVLDDGTMQYLMSDATISVEDGTSVCTAVNFLGLSKENRAKVLYPCTRLIDELTLQQVLEVGEPVETGFNLVKADPEDTEAGTLIDKLEVVDNVRDPDDPDDQPLLHLEVTVDGQGNRKVGINEDALKTFSGNVIDSIETLTELINELPSDEHGYFNSSLYTTPGDGTTTNLVMGNFRISENRDVHGDSIEFVPTHQEGGVDFGEVWLEPGTYILATQFTLQWVGNPRGTFLPLVANVADQPFDFSYEHEDVVRTTRIITKTTRSKLLINIAIDADTPPMGVWVKNLEVAQIASPTYPIVAHDTTLTGTGKVGDPLGVTPAAFGKIKDIPTSISQFRTGDVIPVDGPNGPAKMGKDDLLEISNAPILQMAKPVHYTTIKYGCYYATDFSVIVARGDRAGTEILTYKIGQYIRILPIDGYLVDIEQSDVLGPTTDSVVTGWLNSATLVKVVRKYQSIVVKKVDETYISLEERADISSKIVLEVVDTETVNSNSGKLPTSGAVQDTAVSIICNSVPLLPLLKQGTMFLAADAGSDNYIYGNNDYRCFMPCDAVAPYDLYLTSIPGYMFWAYGAVSTEQLHNLFNTQVHYGQVACIPKGTHYRIVVATDPENTEIGNPDTWRNVVRVVSNIGLRCDLDNTIAMDGTGNLNLAMELGDLDPTTFQRRYSFFRAITVGIQLALTDMFISIKSGYKFVGYKFDADDTPLGFIWDNPREIHHGTIVKIEKGTRYRLMIMKDPEYQDTRADVIEFSKQLVVSSSVLDRIRVLESGTYSGNYSAFDIYGVSNERRRSSPHLIFGGMPLLYEGMQSIAFDRDSGVFYILRGNSGSEVYKYDLHGNRLDTITTKGNTGHDNDACYIDGKIYIAGASSNTSNSLYVWDVAAGTTTELNVTSIPNNPNGSHRVLYGVCQKDNNALYLVCIDLDPNDELNVKNDDVISVYTYDISSGNISLVTTFHRDLVYIQGCTYVNGLLYISGNIMTTGSPSNYRGTSIKILDMSDNSILNEIKFNGRFENEGLDFYEAYGSTHLIICFALYRTRADVCSFIPNW